MSTKRAEMFNKKASKTKYKADKIIQKLSLKQGQVVADIGSGGGFFTYKFAKELGEKGQVYAVDNDQDLLEYIKKQAINQGLNNIVTLFTESEHPDLPKHMFDLLFLRNVTHHLTNRINYFKDLSNTLKPNGKIVIIEYDGRGGFFSFQRMHKHYVPKDKLLDEMKQAGYKLEESYDFLSEQSFSVFTLS